MRSFDLTADTLPARRTGTTQLVADALVHGARAELDLTPKPGLVDRIDNGSHPDLDHARMLRSIELLPRYYDELIFLSWGSRARAEMGRVPFRAEASDVPGSLPLAACIEAGRRAENRMLAAAGANAHRGYIFLSGLVLLAACEASTGSGSGTRGTTGLGASDSALRPAIASIARAFFSTDASHPAERLRQASAHRARACPAPAPAPDMHLPGARMRRLYGLGGVRAEALAGLPSVFEAGLPAYRNAIRAGVGADLASFRALAVLMQHVEDTTAVLRCGPPGLARLRRDGTALETLLDRGEDPTPALSTWNEEYRTLRLTMGGVADCLALVLALSSIFGSG